MATNSGSVSGVTPLGQAVCQNIRQIDRSGQLVGNRILVISARPDKKSEITLIPTHVVCLGSL